MALLGIAVAGGIGLRMWGINFGLPYMYHADEPSKIEVAQEILKTGDLDPHYFLKPPFYSYLNAIVYFPYIALEELRGQSLTIQSLQAPTMLALATGYTPQASTVLLGRLVTLLFASMCIPLTYLLATAAFHTERSALLAAGFVALSPGLIPHSRYITPDSLVVFACLLTAYASIVVYRRGTKLDYALAGAAGALAASAKYSAVLVLVAPVAADLLANGLRGSFQRKRILLSALSALVTFAVLNPIAVLRPTEFYYGASVEATHYATGHLGMEGGAFDWYLSYFATTEGLVAILGALGMAVFCLKRSKVSILLATFPVVFFGFISSFAVRNDRTAIPITPFLYIFAMQWLVTLTTDHSDMSRFGRVRRLAVPTGIALMLVCAAASSVRSTVRLVTPDGRETSRIWIINHMTPGSKFAIEGYSPYIDPKRYHVVGVEALIDHSLAWYRAREVEYVVASQGMYGRFFAEPARYKPEINAYEGIFATFPLVESFDDGGYEIRILRVP